MYTTLSQNKWNNPHATSKKMKQFYHQPIEDFRSKLVGILTP